MSKIIIKRLHSKVASNIKKNIQDTNTHPGDRENANGVASIMKSSLAIPRQLPTLIKTR
jgi:hypothetical protein